MAEPKIMYEDDYLPDNETGPATNTEYNLAKEHDQLERSLKSRHLQFLALGKLPLSLASNPYHFQFSFLLELLFVTLCVLFPKAFRCGGLD